MGKNFKDVAASTKSVYSKVIASAQNEQQVQEVQASRTELPVVPHTQGRKGEKLPRINMAFTPQNLEYLRVMAGLRGQSVTRYVNALVEQDMVRNKSTYAIAKEIAGDV